MQANNNQPQSSCGRHCKKAYVTLLVVAVAAVAVVAIEEIINNIEPKLYVHIYFDIWRVCIIPFLLFVFSI